MNGDVSGGGGGVSDASATDLKDAVVAVVVVVAVAVAVAAAVGKGLVLLKCCVIAIAHSRGVNAPAIHRALAADRNLSPASMASTAAAMRSDGLSIASTVSLARHSGRDKWACVLTCSMICASYPPLSS